MKCRILLIAVTLTSLAALSAQAEPFVFYENDFSTRTSVGAIGGVTTYAYSLGNLIGSSDSTTGTQDNWIRRNSGTAAVTVASNAGNQYARFATTTSFAYALQPIGSEINQGVLRISVDVLAPIGWGGSSRAAIALLGDDDFYAGLLDTAEPTLFYLQTANAVGFQGTTNPDVRFAARSGNGSGSIASVYGAATVNTGNWYRWITDLDL